MENQRVLKAYSLREPGQKVVFDFEDFQQRAGDHLAETRQAAERYLHQVQAEAKSLLEKSQREGFNAGYAAGMQKSAIEIEAKADAKAKTEINSGLASGQKVIDSLAKQIAHAKIEWVTRWETSAIQLCAAIAEKIIHAELANRPALSQTMIQGLLELASSEQRVIARVHPQDAEVMNPRANETGGAPPFGPLVEFRPDASLTRGDCVVELEHGELDGRIATQLARLTAELVPGEMPGSNHA
jgi:flagellar assembly protein FliH